MNVLSKKGGRNHSLVPQSLDSNTVKDSMQYYRVWIYSCNWILGLTSALFTVFAAFVLADVRLSFLRGVELYHPTFIYAYTALIVQCGVIQTVGCLGAQRLSHKLLSIYWIILLLLTIGDVGVGLVWVFKLENIKVHLRPILTKEFIAKYATDADFTKTWNRVQTQEHCCGVNGPLDFEKFSTQVRIQILQEQNVGRTEAAQYLSLPESCCPNDPPIQTTQDKRAFGPFSLSRPPDERIVARSIVPPTSLPRPFTLFLNSNFSYEQSSEEYDPNMPLQGLVSSSHSQQQLHRRRHFVHPRKKSQPNNPQGSQPGSLNGSDSNNSLPYGEGPSTEEPLEAIEISVPFKCRNPEIHTHSQHRRNIPSNPQDDNDGALVEKENIDSKSLHHTTQKSVSSSSSSNIPNSSSSSPNFSRKTVVNRRHASIPNSSSGTSTNSPINKTRVRIYRNGCGLKLMQWLDHISGILFILGFCIIGFIKACFLIILRYEIREMIEKIHNLDAAEDLTFSTSPSRLALLQKQSSLSSGQCHFTGVTIKSPQGDGGPKCFHERNSFISATSIDGGRHHPDCCPKRDRDRSGMRRPSGRSLCDCDRHSSHSQETVNMTVMVTTKQGGGGGRKLSGDESSYFGGGGKGSEPISLIVPKPEERELRRSRFANYGAWDSNVSGESSTSTGGDFPSVLRGGSGCGGGGVGKTEIVQVEMENLSSIQFVDESEGSTGTGAPAPTSLDEELNLMITTTTTTIKSSKESLNEGEVAVLIPQPRLTTRRRNGNNNSVDSTDSVMALIGTAV